MNVLGRLTFKGGNEPTNPRWDGQANYRFISRVSARPDDLVLEPDTTLGMRVRQEGEGGFRWQSHQSRGDRDKQR